MLKLLLNTVVYLRTLDNTHSRLFTHFRILKNL